MDKYNRVGYFIGADVRLRPQLIYDEVKIESNFATNPGGAAEAGVFKSRDRLPRTEIGPGYVRIDSHGAQPFLEIEGTYKDASNIAEPILTLSRRGFNGSDGDRAGTLVFECPPDDSTEGTPIAAFNASWSDVSLSYSRLAIGIKSSAKMPPIAGLEGSYGRVIEGIASGGSQIDVLLAFGTGSTTTIAGGISIGGHTVNDIDIAGEFVDSDEHLMTSAAINDRIAAATTGASVDLTSEVSGVLPVANGGTGASSLTDNKLLTGTGTSAVTAEANATYDGTDLTLTSSTSAKPVLTLENSNTDAVAPILQFTKTDTGTNADEIGMINFIADDNANNPTTFAQIKAEIQDAVNTSEDGQLELLIAQGASLVNVLKANSSSGFGTMLELGDGGLLSMTTFKSTIVGFESAQTTAPIMSITNQTADANGPQWTFIKQRPSSPATLDGDQLGLFNFRGVNAASNITTYAQIEGTAVTTSSGNEAGKIEMKVTSDGVITNNNRNVITGTGHTTVDKVDIDLGYGTASTTTVAGNLNVNGTNHYFTSSDSAKPSLNLVNTNTDANGPELIFDKTSVAGSDNDDIGKIKWNAEDDGGGGPHTFGQILGEIAEASTGQAGGKLSLQIASHDGGLENGLILQEGNVDGEVDATIGNGAASVVTVPGVLSALSGITFDGVALTTLQTSAESFADNDTSLMTSAAIDDRINAAGGGGGGSSKIHMQIMNPSSYIFYLFNDDNWYSLGTTTLAILGSSSAPGDISSGNSEYGARIALYTATAACTVNKLTFNWYWSSSAINGPKAFEFAFSKFTPITNGSAATITMNSIAATDCNDDYSEVVGYQKTFTFSGGNATLAAGDAIAMHMRTTDGSSSQRVLVYGTVTLEAELS